MLIAFTFVVAMVVGIGWFQAQSYIKWFCEGFDTTPKETPLRLAVGCVSAMLLIVTLGYFAIWLVTMINKSALL